MQLLRADRLCNRKARIIRVDIVAVVGIIHSDRTHDRQKILLQKIVENLRIDLRDLTDKPMSPPLEYFSPP